MPTLTKYSPTMIQTCFFHVRWLPTTYVRIYTQRVSNARCSPPIVSVGRTVPRYQYPVLDSPIDSSPLLDSLDDSTRQKQRTKRIYWENLAFHAADFNQKSKKLQTKY